MPTIGELIRASMKRERERLLFEGAFPHLDISDEWDPDGYYDSDVGEDVLNMWNGWLAKAEQTYAKEASRYNQ